MKCRILLILSLIICYSCRDDLSINNPESTDERLRYVISLEESITKGYPIASAQDTAFKSFGLFAYHTSSDFNTSDNITDFFSLNKPVEKNAEEWILDSTYYWPQTGYLTFFAYAPYNSPEIELTYSSGATPVLKYSVPQNVTEQPDLMISIPQKNKYRDTIPIVFKHALRSEERRVGKEC